MNGSYGIDDLIWSDTKELDGDCGDDGNEYECEYVVNKVLITEFNILELDGR